MSKKVVTLGGGTGMSYILKGLKQFPIDITAIVSVCDDGKSTGRLREEFDILAVGDIRKVIIALSKTEPLIEKLLDYRFETRSDLNGHSLGNLLLAGLIDISDDITTGIKSISKILNLNGKVLPLTSENVVLMGEMKDGTIIEGEHNITNDDREIKNVFYKNEPKVLPEVISEIKEADLIVLSMGSIFTSLLPHLISKEIIEAIDQSNADIMYVCNMMTQPGETDNFKASDHVKLINQYLGKRKINAVLVNDGEISQEIKQKYVVKEQKDSVECDIDNLEKQNVKVIADNFVTIDNDVIRHNSIKIGLHIFSYLIM